MDFSSRILAAAAPQQFPLGVRVSLNPPVPSSTKNIAVLGNTVVVTNAIGEGGFSGAVGSFSYSLDAGATWTTKNIISQTTGAILYLRAIVADPILGQFIAASTRDASLSGNTDILFRSTDGVNWFPLTTIFINGVVNAIFYFTAGLYPYVLAAGGIYTSVDGITWTARNSPGFSNVDSIAYGNNTYILVGKADSFSFSKGVRRTTDFASYTTPTFTQITPAVDTLGTSSVVFVNNTFIISATLNGSSSFPYYTTARCAGFIYKSTDNGLNFSLATPGEAYLSNVQYGMFVNGYDDYSQTRPSATAIYSGETTYAYPNRGNPLSFSSPTYSLETRLTNVITTTTTTPTVFGLSSIDTTPESPNNIFGFGGYRISSVRLYPNNSGFWFISTNGSNPGVSVSFPALLNATLRSTISSTNTMQGYGFVLGSLTYIFFFANAIVGGTHYFGTTAYSTADGVTFTEFSALPTEFNVSGPTSASGADYNLTILRGAFGAGGYSYAFNYGPVSAVNIRYMTSATGTSAWTVRTTRVANSQYVSYSANDGTGSAGFIAYLSNGFNGAIPSPNQYKQLVFQYSNNFTLAFSNVGVAGLDGTPVLFNQCTDMTFISSAFRLFCNFNDLLGQPVWGVISITTAGVVSYTVISNFSNMKVLGVANSTVFVVSMDTGAVYTSTNGTTYTLQTTWDSPAMCEDIFATASGSVYTSGRFLTASTFRSTDTANWFTSANGSAWTKTPVTTPSSTALALRKTYPSKYVETQSGQKVAIFTGLPGQPEVGNGTFVGVAAVGSSLAVMPFKSLSINNPTVLFNTVYYNGALTKYACPSFQATAESTDGVNWSVTQNVWDPDTSVITNALLQNVIKTAIPLGTKVVYVITINNVDQIFTADLTSPNSRVILSLPTIGTDYSYAQIATDGITTLASVYSTVGGAARRNYISTDGITWTAVTSAGGQLSILYADPGQTAAGVNKFALAFGSSVSVTANAGATWNTSTSTVNPIRDVTFADGMWVLCGRIQTGTYGFGQPFYAGRIFSSINDGVSWTQQYTTTTTGSTAASIDLVTIAPTGNAKQFVCSGIGNLAASVVLLSNTSGTTYAETAGQRFNTIKYGAGGSPVLLARRSDNFIYGSNNGSTWTQQSQTAVPFSNSSFFSTAIVYTNLKWFVVVPATNLDNGFFGSFIYST